MISSIIILLFLKKNLSIFAWSLIFVDELPEISKNFIYIYLSKFSYQRCYLLQKCSNPSFLKLVFHLEWYLIIKYSLHNLKKNAEIDILFRIFKHLLTLNFIKKLFFKYLNHLKISQNLLDTYFRSIFFKVYRKKV